MNQILILQATIHIPRRYLHLLRGTFNSHNGEMNLTICFCHHDRLHLVTPHNLVNIISKNYATRRVTAAEPDGSRGLARLQGRDGSHAKTKESFGELREGSPPLEVARGLGNYWDHWVDWDIWDGTALKFTSHQPRITNHEPRLRPCAWGSPATIGSPPLRWRSWEVEKLGSWGVQLGANSPTNPPLNF